MIKPSDRIRVIWEEMKKLDRMRKGKFSIEEYEKEHKEKLEMKFQEVEILFGHESTLAKAIIYHLDNS